MFTKTSHTFAPLTLVPICDALATPLRPSTNWMMFFCDAVMRWQPFVRAHACSAIASARSRAVTSISRGHLAQFFKSKHKPSWCRGPHFGALVHLDCHDAKSTNPNCSSRERTQLSSGTFANVLPMYDICSCVLANTSFGHCVERRRRYTLLHLKTRVTLCRQLSHVVDVLGRTRSPSHTWREYFCQAPDSELSNDLAWASLRVPGQRTLPLTLADADAFEKSLLDWEKYSLKIARSDQRNCVYTLSQNADNRRSWSRGDVMQTLIAHSHMMWSDVHNRWLSARKVLSLQGFPVHAHHFKYLGIHESDLCKLCSFNASRASSGMPARNRSAMVRQAGDSMHVSVVGAALLWSAMYTEPSCTPGYFTRVLSDLAIQKVAQTQNSKRMFEQLDNSFPPFVGGVDDGEFNQVEN